MTIRQQILERVKTRFQGILQQNGYHTNLGQQVYVWRTVPFEKADLPAINIRDPEEEFSIVEMGFRRKLTIEVEILSDETIDIRLALADIEKAISQDITWGGLALNTIAERSRILKEQDELVINGAVFTFTIEYRTREWDPETQL